MCSTLLLHPTLSQPTPPHLTPPHGTNGSNGTNGANGTNGRKDLHIGFDHFARLRAETLQSDLERGAGEDGEDGEAGEAGGAEVDAASRHGTYAIGMEYNPRGVDFAGDVRAVRVPSMPGVLLCAVYCVRYQY